VEQSEEVGAAERERRHNGDSVGEKRGRRIIKGWKRVSMMGWFVVMVAEERGKVAITIISTPFCLLREEGLG
jgi:hypothetical protein